MRVTGFDHPSVECNNFGQRAKCYETVVGMESIPSCDFGFKTRYLRGGDLQLHNSHPDQPRLETARRPR